MAPRHRFDSMMGKSPSGEEATPGRSMPLDACSTEDHDHHLEKKAAISRCFQPTPRPRAGQEVGVPRWTPARGHVARATAWGDPDPTASAAPLRKTIGSPILRRGDRTTRPPDNPAAKRRKSRYTR